MGSQILASVPSGGFQTDTCPVINSDACHGDRHRLLSGSRCLLQYGSVGIRERPEGACVRWDLKGNGRRGQGTFGSLKSHRAVSNIGNEK